VVSLFSFLRERTWKNKKINNVIMKLFFKNLHLRGMKNEIETKKLRRKL
jgi:hypothetical protein